ncbi:U2 small nuclear ribonucleoprotein A' [Angomonas deanei]|uniref:Dynein regulatory complex subunit 3 n=1 Tax=Angomonas deanei TaxID=59799 RepID=A0A7G2CDI4_9TRYP|nr:U2 small nuclear ribonucleoprotein A' [Angomonas deanei]CAD2217900.1 Leucine Rich repeats (2 copies)/Leucine-rich repeat, putative [Angomonas deanei]|eukprot:EPY37882.1 U2 small nuclear ribonucleoprotein A' [Angomonas deanei]
MIRKCIHLESTPQVEDDRLRVVGNREEANLQQKVENEVRTMDLDKVEVLTISFQRIGKIENLFGLSHLVKLCLDNNHISKIENLGQLSTLRVLDLSFNQIETIENLDDLTELEDVSFYGNKIKHVSGMDTLTKIVSLNLGKNQIENLDETVTYLHRFRSLKVLVLKGCPLQTIPNCRNKVLAFVSTIRFLDGVTIKPDEIQRAKDEQRENLLQVDEEDEKQAKETALREQEEQVRAEYARYNCPNELKLYDDLFKLSNESFTLADVLRSDALIAASKEPLEHFQTEFNDKLKELADAMKSIRAKRDEDDKNYENAVKTLRSNNFAQCLSRMKEVENKIRRATNLKPADIATIKGDVALLQEDLVEKEAEQFETMEALNTATLGRWKTDGVDVILQSSFETLQKIESDFQVSIRQIFDSLYEQRKKKTTDADGDFYFGARQENIKRLLESREDYGKFLNDVFEMRRKKLEDLELFHLSTEEQLLTERSTSILRREQERHRLRLDEIETYIKSLSSQISNVK